MCGLLVPQVYTLYFKAIKSHFLGKSPKITQSQEVTPFKFAHFELINKGLCTKELRKVSFFKWLKVLEILTHHFLGILK